jgi:hypothetical protein
MKVNQVDLARLMDVALNGKGLQNQLCSQAKQTRKLIGFISYIKRYLSVEEARLLRDLCEKIKKC